MADAATLRHWARALVSHPAFRQVLLAEVIEPQLRGKLVALRRSTEPRDVAYTQGYLDALDYVRLRPQELAAEEEEVDHAEDE